MRRKNPTFSNMAQAAKRHSRLIAALSALALLALIAVTVRTGLASAYPLTAPATEPAAALGSDVASVTSQIETDVAPVPRQARTDADTSETPRTVEATTVAGVSVRVTPDETRSIAPGYSIDYSFDITNETSVPGLFDLTTTTTAGFDTQIHSLAGASVATVSLAASETTRVVATVSVPDTATVGTIDVSTLAVALDTSPSVSAQASAVTEVLDGLTLTPNNAGDTSPETDITYRHSIVNSWPTTRTISLSSIDASDWPVAFFASDGRTAITTVTVGPYGGRQEVLARLSVLSDAIRGTVDTLTVVATSESTTATAIDTTFIRRLDTYAGASDSTPCSNFRLGDTVFARGMGLDPGSVVCFVWKDPHGNVARTSATSTVDTTGTACDQYSSLTTDSVGDWSVELHADEAEGSLIETRTFTLTYRGEIVSLSASDGRTIDALISVSSSVRNDTSQEITGSTTSYLLWWDDDENGVFDEGDTCIDASGSPQPLPTSASTHVSTIPSVAASGTWTEPAPWTMTNSRFPNEGTYNVTAVWRSSTGAVIDQKTAQFYAIPTLGWPPLLLLVGIIGYATWRRGGLPCVTANRCGCRSSSSRLPHDPEPAAE